MNFGHTEKVTGVSGIVIFLCRTSSVITIVLFYTLIEDEPLYCVLCIIFNYHVIILIHKISNSKFKDSNVSIKGVCCCTIFTV